MTAVLNGHNHSNGPYFMPLFRALFQKHLISVERMATGGVLQRILIFLNACKVMIPVPFPMELHFFDELCSEIHNRSLLHEGYPVPLRAKLQEVFKRQGFNPGV